MVYLHNPRNLPILGWYYKEARIQKAKPCNIVRGIKATNLSYFFIQY
jgi:hypothetical protein